MALMGEGYLIISDHPDEFRAPERADYMAVSELESVIRDLLAAGVTLSHLPLDMPLAHFQPRRARRLRADLLLLRQMRTGRRLAIRLGRCAQTTDRALGLRRAGPARAVTVMCLWGWETAWHWLRTRMRFLKSIYLRIVK